jgi:stringent starvation protein B
MTSNRPYLIRALYEWITDNGMTPYVIVDATRGGVQVPSEYVEEGRIVLNVGPTAVQGLSMTNQAIDFSARFGGHARHVHLPPDAVMGIYAQETSQGMLFPEESPAADRGEETPDDGGSDATDPKGGKRPSLKIIK